jgi:long-chain fatty acid transport protein
VRKNLTLCGRAALAVLVVALAGEASAGSFAVDAISARGLGRANSGEVADTGAEALFWNPAGIARAPRELMFGGDWTSVSETIQDNGSTITRPIAPGGFTTPVGGTQHISKGYRSYAAPVGAISLPIGDTFAVGLSVDKPFRLKGDFGVNGFGRYDTIRNSIDTTDVQLTGAAKATDWLDLGAGVIAQHMKASLDSASPNLNPAAPDALQSLVGSSWNYGWTVGAQAHLSTVTLGLSYRSAIHQHLSGSLSLSGLLAPLDTANFAAPASTAFSTPWSAAFGARWAVTPQLTLDGQIVRSGWSEYDAITVGFAGQTAIIPQNYKDTTSVALGADFALSDTYTLRGGIRFDPTPTPDNLREPGVADSDRWVYAVGASARLSGGATLEAAVSYSDFQRSRIFDDLTFYGGTPAQTTTSLRGSFSGHAVVSSVGLSWRF